MRTREEIEKDYNDCVSEIKENKVFSYEARSGLRSAMANVLSLETLLDIRDLLSTQNEKECPAGTKKHLNYLESHNYCSHCHATKEEPKEVDV